jgi:hypothetical protein
VGAARQHGLDVHVLERVTSGPNPALVRALGATYHSGAVAEIGFEPDIVLECRLLISRRERPEDFARALARSPDDIKVVVQFADA